MNEEIQATFGANTGPIDRAMRSLKQRVTDWGTSVADSFKSAFSALAAPLSVAGVIATFDRVLEKVKQIRRASEGAGVSSDFFQDLVNVGRVSGLASDQIERMLDKFVKGRTAGADIEAEFYKFADSIAATHDPVTRLNMAVAAFGERLGPKLIETLSRGSSGVKELAAQFSKLSEAEMDSLESLNIQVEKAGNSWTNFFAKAFVGWNKLLFVINEFGKNKDNPLLFFANIWAAVAGETSESDARKAQRAVQKQASEIAAVNAQSKKESAAIRAEKEAQEKYEYKHMNYLEKVEYLTRKQNEAKARAASYDKPGFEDERALMVEKIFEFEDKIRELKEKQLSTHERLNKQIDDTKTKLADEKKLREEHLLAPYMPSLDQLASSGQWVATHQHGPGAFWQQGPFAWQANRIKWLENDAQQSLIWGNKGRAIGDRSEAERLKKQLRDAGIITSDMRDEMRDDAIKNTAKHLERLVNRQATLDVAIKEVDTED